MSRLRQCRRRSNAQLAAHVFEQTLRPVNSVTSLGFQGALYKENYRLPRVFENFAAKRLDISFLFRQAVLEILFER